MPETENHEFARLKKQKEEKVKRRYSIGISVCMALVLLTTGVVPAMAAKPSGGSNDVIARSNGFPSGEHFNLNIHGKKADYAGNTTPGGNSVFILEYGNSTIEYVTNKKSSLSELYVLDPLAEAFDGDAAKVQLPYEAEGYYVFGRILAKPNNGKIEPVSSIILFPNQVVAAYNDNTSDPDFGNYTGDESALLDLGLIVGPNLYTAEPEGYVRFDPETTGGKGRSKATDITSLFTYTGWVIDSRLDTNGPLNDGQPDGIISIWDVPLGNYDIATDPTGLLTPDNRDYNNDGTEDEADVAAWLEDNPTLAWYYENEWILNIADLVITEQGLVNDGTKLLQVRFYPVDTTVFNP